MSVFLIILGVATLTTLGFLAIVEAASYGRRLYRRLKARKSTAVSNDLLLGVVNRLQAEVKELRKGVKEDRITPGGVPVHQSIPRSTPVDQGHWCPLCGGEGTLIEWGERGNRKAGKAYKCLPCQKWIPKQKKGGTGK